MTDQVSIGSTQLEELFAKHIQNMNNTTINGVENDKPTLGMDPRALFAGRQMPMSVLEAYSEHVMNVYDVSTENSGREIDFWMYANYTGPNVTALNFEDNGPGLPTDPQLFLDTYLKLSVNNKVNNDNTVGDAGIGGKAANAKLAKRHTYSWSDGNGHKCTIIVDEDNFIDLTAFDEIKKEKYDGPSFFKIKLDKLRMNDIKAPSEMRNELEEKFKKRLATHKTVSIYTSAPVKKKAKKLEEPADYTYLKGYKWEGIVNWSGFSAEVSVGMLDSTVHNTGILPSVHISKQGVVHFKKSESPAHKYLFVNKRDGSPTVFSTLHRGLLLTIDSKHFESSQIKNDLNWDNPTTIGLLKAIGTDKNVADMVKSIVDYNTTNKKDKTITSAQQKNLDVLIAAAASEFNKIFKDEKENSNYSANPSKIDASKATTQKRDVKPTKHSKNTTKAPAPKPTININGNKFLFDVKFVTTEDTTSRFYAAMAKGMFTISINTTYAGYTSLIEKDQPELVYVADTVGYALQDYSIKKLINDSHNKSLDADDINKISLSRDAMVTGCLKALANPNPHAAAAKRVAVKNSNTSS